MSSDGDGILGLPVVVHRFDCCVAVDRILLCLVAMLATKLCE